jgi:hypothetical protein
MHNRSKSFFDNLKGVDQLFYTCDGQHFKTEEGASANARNLKKKSKSDVVTLVTRAECENAAAAQLPNGTIPPLVELTTGQKTALTKAKNNLVKLAGFLEEAKKDGVPDNITECQAAYDDALAALVAMPGYVADTNG